MPSTRTAFPALLFLALLLPLAARAFCGFYVGKADASLFNEASQVVFVRDGDRSVITMQNDYRGDLTEFAMVVPVPEAIDRASVRVVDRALFARIDAYSAPRLAEYHDANPCVRLRMEAMERRAAPASAAPRDHALGVTVQDRYTVGEYDIVILSASQSDGLETWLRENGYRLPDRSGEALKPYIRQGMKFFVARVNIGEQVKTGSVRLRPLQIRFRSERFMLPIRLGMLNAAGPQDLVAFMLTRNGRVETTNYRTVRLPANVDLPGFVRSDFGGFYRALFDEQVRRKRMRAVFTEYFWDMSWCDPCAADPLSPEELRQAGVDWIGDEAVARRPRGGGRAQPVMLTRLHLRYTADTFPEDLVFQETRDRSNFQTRYVLRNAWRGDPGACTEARVYLDALAVRREQEARTLAQLTGWSLDGVRERMRLGQPQVAPWWLPGSLGGGVR